MKYVRFKNKILARVDKGEEILSAVLEIAAKENIGLASVSAVGATDNFTVGVFGTDGQQYEWHDFCGDFEILSLAGNVTLADGKPYVHAHMCAAGKDGKAVGGHLKKAMVSVTCELFLDVAEGKAERAHNRALGINELNL